MNTETDYGLKKISLAIERLLGEGDLILRLKEAYYYHLILIKPEKDLPSHLHDNYKALMSMLDDVETLSMVDARHALCELMYIHDHFSGNNNSINTP
ncbi:hypothetical protein [Endozoicomonas atrinae]|uniref:hypothetical protein n=1 Tax=Endozoicomonas atrinae TaxID=1333660 RepID=UPI0008263D45|nr:hypothetical protein [Endozoicomonas atrinae]